MIQDSRQLVEAHDGLPGVAKSDLDWMLRWFKCQTLKTEGVCVTVYSNFERQKMEKFLVLITSMNSLIPRKNLLIVISAKNIISILCCYQSV